MLVRFDCWITTVGRSLISFLKSGNSTPIDGCTYSKHEIHSNCEVVVSYCEHCDKVSITWSQGKTSDEDKIMRYGTKGD